MCVRHIPRYTRMRIYATQNAKARRISFGMRFLPLTSEPKRKMSQRASANELHDIPHGKTRVVCACCFFIQATHIININWRAIYLACVSVHTKDMRHTSMGWGGRGLLVDTNQRNGFTHTPAKCENGTQTHAK